MHARTIIAATAMIAGTGVSAYAADMPAYEPMPEAAAAPPMEQPRAFDWTGVYVGANAGYAAGDFSTFTPGPATGGEFTGKGFFGGVQAGYNYQTGNIVIGVEGDAQYSGVDGSTDFTTAVGGDRTEGELSWFATGRGRVGYAFDRFMLYGTGGVAAGNLELSADGTGPGSGSDDKTAWGYTIGAGVEAAVTENVTLKGEYLYLDLGKETLNLGGQDQTVEYDTHLFRIGANYKF